METSKNLIDSEIAYLIAQNNNSMPCESGMDDPSIVELRLRELQRSRDQTNVQIAEKRLQIFDSKAALTLKP